MALVYPSPHPENAGLFGEMLVSAQFEIGAQNQKNPKKSDILVYPLLFAAPIRPFFWGHCFVSTLAVLLRAEFAHASHRVWRQR